MSRVNFDTLLEAGCHFGHLKRKWNPAMAPYIFMERNGIHIIDLNKTVAKVDEAAEALKQIAKSGKKVLFVATKKQAKQVVAEKAASVNMPYVIERWPGGMLTNFPTIRKAVKKMATIDKLTNDGTYSNLSKREVLQISRQRAKLEKNLGSIADLTRLPSALFVIDVLKENIAVREANRLGIPVFAIVDTNSDPSNVDFVIPANDDATKSVEVILDACCAAMAEGLEERKAEKVDMEAAGENAPKAAKKKTTKKSTEKLVTADRQVKAVPAPKPRNTTPLPIASQRFIESPAGQSGFGYAVHLQQSTEVYKMIITIRTSGGQGYLRVNTTADPNAGQQVAQFAFAEGGTTEVTFDKPVTTQDILLWVPMDSLPQNQLYINKIEVF